MYTVEIGSDVIIYIQSFIKICTVIYVTLWLYRKNLRGCNVGITDRRDGFMGHDVRTK
jgi:hypothetical protein